MAILAAPVSKIGRETGMGRILDYDIRNGRITFASVLFSLSLSLSLFLHGEQAFVVCFETMSKNRRQAGD